MNIFYSKWWGRFVEMSGDFGVGVSERDWIDEELQRVAVVLLSFFMPRMHGGFAPLQPPPDPHPGPLPAYRKRGKSVLFNVACGDLLKAIRNC